MKKSLIILIMFGVLCFGTSQSIFSQGIKKKVAQKADTTAVVKPDSMAVADSTEAAQDSDLMSAVDTTSIENLDDTAGASGGLHKMIKQKFIEGNAGFMSLRISAKVLPTCSRELVLLPFEEITSCAASRQIANASV